MKHRARNFRQLHVMDESYLINQVKEDVCYVAQNFMEEMKLARKRLPENKIIREYVLPDYTNIKRGFIRSESDTGKRAVENEQVSRSLNQIIPGNKHLGADDEYIDIFTDPSDEQ